MFETLLAFNIPCSGKDCGTPCSQFFFIQKWAHIGVLTCGKAYCNVNTINILRLYRCCEASKIRLLLHTTNDYNPKCHYNVQNKVCLAFFSTTSHETVDGPIAGYPFPAGASTGVLQMKKILRATAKLLAPHIIIDFWCGVLKFC